MLNLGGAEIVVLLVLCGVPALVIAGVAWYLIARSRHQAQTTRNCPYCAETIKKEATVCRFCGREVPALPTEGA